MQAFGLMFLLSYHQEPLFLAHGCAPHSAPGRGFRRFTVPLDRDFFRWHGDAKLDGRDCTVLRTLNRPGARGETYYEYWVDRARESAVLRYVAFRSGARDQVDIDYRSTAHGWFPSGYRWAGVTRDGGLTTRLEFTVDEMLANPVLTDDLFHTKPKAGMIVKDDSTGETYVYGGEGRPNVDVREHYLQRLRASQEPRLTRWTAIMLIVSAMLVAAAILVRRLFHSAH